MPKNVTMDTLIERSSRTASGCWEFVGANRLGYGRIWTGERVADVHRLAWELTSGPIPPGMVVCHKCDNPPCFNPDHLFVGTQGDNLRDMAAKGRWRGGYSHCKRGHEMSGDNIASNGKNTTCRACRKITTQAYYERQKSLA